METEREKLVEQWKEIEGYEGYSVCNLGFVRCKTKIMKPDFTTRYCRIKFYKNGVYKNKYIHVLVTDAFMGPCPAGLQRNHKDGNRKNNRIDNLEFVTPSENIKHSLYNGLRSTSKLRHYHIPHIRKMRRNGYTYAQIGKKFGCSEQNIGSVIVGRSWKNY